MAHHSGTSFPYYTYIIVVVIVVYLCMSICASQSKWSVLVDFSESYCNCIASYNVTWLVFIITSVLPFNNVQMCEINIKHVCIRMCIIIVSESSKIHTHLYKV